MYDDVHFVHYIIHIIHIIHIITKSQPKVPTGMYEQVCSHFKKDPSKGIDWLSVFALWKQSNPSAVKPNPTTSSIESGSPKKKETPPPKKQNTQRPMGNVSNFRRVQTTTNLETKNKQNSSKQTSQGQPRHISPAKSIPNVMARHKSTESWSGNNPLTAANLS